METHWVSIHIFYNGNRNHMLTTCLGPLVQDLRERNLVQRFFFIRYWQEGPHIRLRLLPAPGVGREDICVFVEPAVSAYLKQRPALYDVDPSEVQELYKGMFIAEYGEEKWNQMYGKSGGMPIRPNNTFAYIDYEPEYQRYGGKMGVELAEWHFERSSEVVLQLLQTTNAHMRSILLGHGLQLSFALCYGLLGDDRSVRTFFEHYMQFWQNFQRSPEEQLSRFQKSFAQQEVQLRQRIRQIRAAVVEGAVTGCSSVERKWMAHIRELRTNIETLTCIGRLTITKKDGTELVAEQPAVASSFLLDSYIHMTNNRLGLSIADEIYLSYLLKRGLEQCNVL